MYLQYCIFSNKYKSYDESHLYGECPENIEWFLNFVLVYGLILFDRLYIVYRCLMTVVWYSVSSQQTANPSS